MKSHGCLKKNCYTNLNSNFQIDQFCGMQNANFCDQKYFIYYIIHIVLNLADKKYLRNNYSSTFSFYSNESLLKSLGLVIVIYLIKNNFEKQTLTNFES